MLKKITIVAAVVAATALAAGSFAFADQEKHQVSNEGNGLGHGNNKFEGNSENPDTLLCNVGVAVHDEPNEEIHPSEGPCENVGEAYGQKTEQYHTND